MLRPTIDTIAPTTHPDVVDSYATHAGRLSVRIARGENASRFELYDISNDPEEATNVADRYPERVKQMLAKLGDYAYEMAPAKYLEELVATKAGQTPIFWRVNPVRR